MFKNIIPIHEKTKYLLQNIDKLNVTHDLKLFDKYKNNEVFNDPTVWTEKLISLECTEENLIKILSFDDNNFPIVKELIIFLNKIVNEAQLTNNRVNKFNYNESEEINFFPILSPLFLFAEKKIRTAISNINLNNKKKFDLKAICKKYLCNFNLYVKNYISSSLVKEIHVASKAGLLKGQTPKERFEDFSLNLSNSPEWIEYYFLEYPVVLFRLYMLLTQWEKNIIEVITRLDSDLWEIFKLTDSDKNNFIVMGIDNSLGDMHCLGKSVSLINFTNNQRVVYKPKPLNIENRFINVLNWIEKKGFPLSFILPDVIERDGYGWMEYVYDDDCEKIDEISNFFQRQGAFLAIAYTLGGCDLIADNIIAQKENPILFDLECIFSPMIFHVTNNISHEENFLYNSVLRTGILPKWSQRKTDSPGMNYSGVSKMDGQIVKNIITWKNMYTDKMRQHKADYKFVNNDSHLPSLKGNKMSIKNYTDVFIKGFVKCYNILMINREELLSPNSVLFSLKNERIRMIFRDTNKYFQILKESWHPDYLKDALSTDHLYNKMWASYSKTFSSNIIKSEIEQLWKNDIPFFFTYMDSKCLWDGLGNKIEENFLSKSAIDNIKSNIMMLSENDLKIQLELIRQSFSIFGNHLPKKNKINAPLPLRKKKENTILPKDDLISKAISIGDFLIEKSISTPNGISWVGPVVDQSFNIYVQSVLPRHLYSGTSGIALFFSYLYKYSNDKKYYDVAIMIINECINNFLSLDLSYWKKASKAMIGVFNYPGSLIYLLDNTQDIIMRNLQSIGIIENYLDVLDIMIPKDKNFDYLTGVAGCIPQLLTLYKVYKNKRALEMALRCTNHLINNAKKKNDLLYWDGFIPGLGGLSHGTAGISLSLFMIAATINDNKIKKIAEKALRYDRSLFNTSVGSWQDLRYNDKKVFCSAWCHGAAGVGFSRLLLQQYIDDFFIKKELEFASININKFGFGKNHCICHGDLGNLEILTSISQFLEDQQTIESIKSYLLKLLRNSNDVFFWKNGSHIQGINIYDLFLGIAGIGYNLLRFADWENVPSLLNLESLCNMDDLLHKKIQ